MESQKSPFRNAVDAFSACASIHIRSQVPDEDPTWLDEFIAENATDVIREALGWLTEDYVLRAQAPA